MGKNSILIIISFGYSLVATKVPLSGKHQSETQLNVPLMVLTSRKVPL
jgi:hypothetical protein